MVNLRVSPIGSPFRISPRTDADGDLQETDLQDPDLQPAPGGISNPERMAGTFQRQDAVAPPSLTETAKR